MISKEAFSTVFYSAVEQQSKAAALAYDEVSADVASGLYSGRAEAYLAEKGDQGESTAELEFGPDAVISATAVAIPILSLIKLAAETYLVLKKATGKEAENHDSIRAELEVSYSKHISKGRAKDMALSISLALKKVH